MKFFIIFCLALSSSLALADEEALKRLDALFDLRIKANEDYRDQYTEEAAEIENKEAREFLVKSEKENGQLWVDFTKRMKANPDLTARLQYLRIEIVSEIHTAYYDLEYAESVKDQFSARSTIAKFKKQLRELEEIEGLLKKAPKK